ncbi:MAG: T9SS type A sorting domain-containing protein, partial [Bacteroidota bacterium]|nr:T9SS type A sorting domain-containing protein [Bacteroidota bacterium]
SFVDVEHERGALVSVIENNSQNNEADELFLTRQGRAYVGVTFGVSAGAEVDLGVVSAGAGASAGVGGGIAGVTEDYYSFPYSGYDNWQAVAQYILFADGNHGVLDNTMIRLLTACQNAFSNQSTLTTAYKGDKKGIDVEINAKAEASAGANALNAIDLKAEANIGSEGHAYLNITYLIENNEYEYSFGVSGNFSTDASVGLTIDIVPGTNMDDIDEEIDLWEEGGRRAFEFSAFRDNFTNQLTFFELRFLKRNEGTGKAEKISYKVSAQLVLNALSNSGSEIMEIVSMNQNPGSFIISNSTFQQIAESLFNAFLSIQTDPQGNATISYKLEKTDILIVEENPSFSISAQLTTPLRLGISGGNGFEKSKSMLVKSGKWVMGKHYPEWTYDDDIPELPVVYEDMVQEIIDEIPWYIIGPFAAFDFLTGILSKSDSTFWVGDNNSYITFSQSSWPANVDTVTCASWSWYGNAPSKGKSQTTKSSLKVFKQNKALAEASFGMEYGVGGFYQFEPYDTILPDTAWFTILYSDSDIVNMDETSLAMYYEDKENHQWIFVGGTVDTANNSLSAPINQLALYTLAPAMPYGSFGLNANPDTIFADSISTSIITSDTIRNNDFSTVADGQLFTVKTNHGSIINTDADTILDGLQIESLNGLIQFELKSSHVAGSAKVTARSITGSAVATDTVVFFDTIPPATPINLTATADNGKVHLSWNPVNEADLGGYIVYFDTDTTIPPYEGISTVWGKPSPIIVGVDTSYTVYGLFNDTLYHFAVTAIDISGNESGYSNVANATPFFDSINYGLQTIALPSEWSIFSTYIEPTYQGIDSVLVPILSNIIIVKNGNGQSYWPQYYVNLIGNVTPGEGYQIKLLNADTFTVSGEIIQPENTPVEMPLAWSILGYLRINPAPIADMLSPVVNNLVIVKDDLGLIYWPVYGVDLIGNMNPGEGYQVKMSAQDTLVYPSNEATFTKIEINNPQPKFYKRKGNSGNNMTLGIPLSSWVEIPEMGDEIGIFNQLGLLVGSGVFTGENAAITIWGDDRLTNRKEGLFRNEKFSIRLWSSVTGQESDIAVTNWIEGDDRYSKDKISVVGELSLLYPKISDKIILYQNTPNPFSQETEFSFYLPEKAYVELTILAANGNTIEKLVNEELEAGTHKIRFHTKDLPAGNYLYRLETEGFSETRKMVIMK